MSNKIENKKEESGKKDRHFIPLVSPYTNKSIIKCIMPHTDWIGFNYFELRRSKFYSIAKEKGIKNTYEIDDKKKIFISSTAEDEKLKHFYGNQHGIETYLSDIASFGVDIAMGPDWFVYENEPISDRRRNLRQAIELNEKCIEFDNIIPTIHGTDYKEIIEFVKPFREHGRKLFALPGRGRLINLGDRKKSQRDFSTLTSIISQNEKIELIVTGSSSPKLHESLPEVIGFVSLGWLIQSRQRRLIMGKTFRSIFDPKFACNDSICCDSLSINEIASKEYDSNRAIHNLVKISSALGNCHSSFQRNLVM